MGDAIQQGRGHFGLAKNSAAANGGLGGNPLKSLQSFGQGTANQAWQQYLSNVNNGYQGLVGNLSSLTGLGESAASGAGSGALATGKLVGSNLIGAGASTAAGKIGSASALAGGMNGALGGLGNNASVIALLNQLQSGGGNALSNWWSGATQAANDQYANPDGATGNGLMIVGSNGMMGGGT